MAAAFVNDILDTMVDNIEKGLDLDTAMNEAVDSYVPTTDAEWLKLATSDKEMLQFDIGGATTLSDALINAGVAYIEQQVMQDPRYVDVEEYYDVYTALHSA